MAINVKNTTLPSLLDLIAPHICRGCGKVGTVLCECCKNDIICCNFDICPRCKKEKHGRCKTCTDLPRTYAVGKRDGVLAELIHDYKYHSAKAIGRELAEMMTVRLPDGLAVIVPLPTSTKHIRERGFDHMGYLAKKVARMKGWEVEKVLTREKNTVQVGTDKETRQKQAEAAYGVNPKLKVDSKKTYILLDDVWTTGASMMAAVKKMKLAGAKKIEIAVLAISEND